MGNLQLSFATLLLAGGSILLGLALFAWRRRSVLSGAELSILLLAAAVWVLGNAAEHLTTSLDGKVLAAKIQYIGILALSPATLVTVLVATGRSSWIRRYITVAAGLATCGMVVVATNELHGWIWSSVELTRAGSMSILAVQHGPGFWIINVASYLQLLAAALFFLPQCIRNWRANATFAYIGFGAPWIANIIYVTESGPWPHLDFTPVGLVVTGVCLTIAFRGFGSVFSTVMLAHLDVLENISDLVLVSDGSGHLLWANRPAHEALELPPLPTTVHSALAEEHPLRQLLGGAASLARNEDISLSVAGAMRIFDIRSVPVTSAKGRSCGVVFVLRDVTEQRASEDESRTHREQLRQIIDLIPHPLFAKDSEGRFLLANEACARAYQRTPSEITGLSLVDVHSNADEVARILAADRRVIKGRSALTVEETLGTGTADKRTYRITKVPFIRHDSESAAVLGIAIDITEEKERERLLESLASTDSLTNLANRRSFHHILTNALDTAGLRHETAALLFLDLDRFKTANDIYGHLTGDEVLRQVATRIQEVVRFSDPVWSTENARQAESTVSRFGGDEFVVLLPSILEHESAALVARRLIEVLNKPFEIGGDQLQLGVSIGIAVHPADGVDAETLLRHADQALTSAKQSGRGRYEFFNETIGRAEERRHELEKGLRHALERNELSLHYQPIRDVRSAALVGGEALLRWTNPELGNVSPDEFIPVAEETGLVIPIGLFVIREVCEQMIRWQRQGYRLPRLSINLSPRQLADTQSAAMITSVLEETGIAGEKIEFELAEGSILSKNPIVASTLNSLRELGATFALDDFGTGYSSLSQLRRFSFQRLKIDRSFVAGICTTENDEKLVRAIVAMAEQLDLETIAEGVETEEQMRRLLDLGCDLAQGFLLGRPMLAADFERLLDRDKPDA